MNRDIFGIQKEYLLLHEVLKSLRRFGYTLTRSGNDEEGNKIIYEYNLYSSKLEFGVLCAVLNEAEIVNPKGKEFNYASKLDVKDKDIPIKNYSIEEISKAIDTLEAAFEVIVDRQGELFKGTFIKTISLSKGGLYSFNTNKYLKLFKEDKDKEVIHQSTLNTNSWMKIFTGVVALSALITLFIQFPTCKSNTQSSQMEQGQSKPQIHKINNVAKDSPPQEYNIELKKKIKNDSTK